MNNDIKFEIAKYLNTPLEYPESYFTGKKNYDYVKDICREINFTLRSREFLIQRITNTSKTLNKKLLERPSLEDLKNKNIIRNEIVLKEVRDKVSNLLNIRTKNNFNKVFIAPSISNLVKKMNFEYKKIVIIHKLKIKRNN